MKISYNWLKTYLPDLASPDKVADMLTGCGLEVEGQETVHSVKGGLRGVVIGEVLTCEKHPNSDHLSITTVSTGGETPLQVVCGAANVAAGQKVALATLGTTLYFDDKEVTLQRTKIRGVVSEGMICAEDELGLGTSHAGILVLDPGAVAGTPAAEYFGVEEDVVYTIGLTPNRVDAASHIGVARDLAAVMNSYGRSVPAGQDRSSIRIPDVSGFREDHDRNHIPVAVEDAAACPRYSGLTMTGIRVAESPSWLKNRLSAIGLRPINNIVDITNFVLMETGQPLHAFDCDRIEGRKVIVKKYPAGTRFTTLDGVERELTADDLMISHSTEPMCMAGIFGGLGSGVTDSTTSVFLESACFDPRHIRKSSKHHGLQTDASFRFERGSDPSMTLYALMRTAMLIREIAGGEISSSIVDICPSVPVRARVHFSWAHLDRLAGKVLDREVVTGIFSDLGIGWQAQADGSGDLLLSIPTAKVDVTREADVIEEVLRIYGYNNIETPQAWNASISHPAKPDPEKVRNIISDYLVSNGFFEVMNNSLTRSTYYTGSEDFPESKLVKMLNPISRDLDVMRMTLLHGMLETINYNQNRRNPDLKLFEFGRVSSLSDNDGEPVNGYHQERHLALALTGRLRPENWNTDDSMSDPYALKGFIEAVFSRVSVPLSRLTPEPCRSSTLNGAVRYKINGETLMETGSVSRGILKDFDCRQPVFYAEINWDILLALLPAGITPYREVPRFPEVRRDLALVVDRGVTFAEMEEAARQTERKILKSVGLFDVYEGDKIEAGKKSYALSFILLDENKTLTDKEIDKAMDRIRQAMATRFGARLR